MVENNNAILGPPVGYIDLLNHGTAENLAREKAEGKFYNKSPIRPSSAGKCARELYYETMQYSGRAQYETEPTSPELHRLFSLGHTIESHLIKQIESNLEMVEVRYRQQCLSFFRIEAEKDKALSQWLEGSMDLCLWSKEWKCAIDVKSKKDKHSSYHGSKWDEESEKYSKMKSVRVICEPGVDNRGKEKQPCSFWVEDLDAFLDELNDPYFAANFLQLNLYCNSEFLKSRGVDHAAIIQYNKNDSRLREVRFKPSVKLYNQVRAKFEGVIQAVDLNKPELAPKDYMLGSMKCAFCPFKAQCWNENTLRAWFKTFGEKKWPTDLDRLPEDIAQQLVALFSDFTNLETVEKDKARVEETITKLLVANEVSKLRLPDGNVYEAVHLKSPRPHIKLRRGK